MTDLKAKLDELSANATPGEWCQFGLCNGPYQAEARDAHARKEYGKIDTSHHMSAVRDGEPYRLAEWHHAHDAGLVETLVNAYRSGDLITRDAGIREGMAIALKAISKREILTAEGAREHIRTTMENYDNDQ